MLFGTVLNVLAIIIGSLAGLALKRRLPERVRLIMIEGLGLAVVLVGLKMIWAAENMLIVLVSIVLGGVIGEVSHLQERLEAFGFMVETRLSRENGAFAKAFVTSTLLYCVGPLAILGSLQDGLHGDVTLLATKSGLDGVSSVTFAATLGVGVLFSTIPVLLYQGGITLGASILTPYLSQPVINAITSSGGLLVIGIALNILQIAKIKVANLLPAILIAALLAALL
jgi:uncharacterized membrane protein YqgA involved in biofilm formation